MCYREKFDRELKLVEGEKENLTIEITFLRDKIRSNRQQIGVLQSECNDFFQRLQKAAQDYADILQNKEDQIMDNEKQLSSLQQQNEQMEQQINFNNTEIAKLMATTVEQNSKLEDAANMLNDKEKLEEAVQKQANLIEKQKEEIRNLMAQIEEKSCKLADNEEQIQHLELKASSKTELKILFEEPWLLQTTRHKLKGDIPLDRETNTLTCVTGNKLVLVGGSGRQDTFGKEVLAVDLESMTWDRSSAGRASSSLYSHQASAVGRTKMIIFGGFKNEAISNELTLLNTESMKWNKPLVKGGRRPSARIGHVIACVREKIFVFGGQSEEQLLDDVWYFDMDQLCWTQMTVLGPGPTPRKGASMSPSEDGRRLYIFGGNDGSKCQNDMYFLETERGTWSTITASGVMPDCREGHTSSCVSRFLFISGGYQIGENGSSKRLCDTWVMDLSTSSWDVLDDGVWANGLQVFFKQTASYVAFCGSKLYILKPDRGEKLQELQIIDISLPDDIERMKKNKKREADFASSLEILDDYEAGSNYLEIGWRAPTLNSDRIDNFKLMFATTTGVVKEIGRGRHTRQRITGLLPNTEYILCVKVTYDDGSFLWSESKSFCTLK